MRMMGWMCGMKIRGKLSCIELRQRLEIEDKVKWYREMDCDNVDIF